MNNSQNETLYYKQINYDYEDKIKLSEETISDWINHWGIRKVYASISFGSQSVVLFDLVAKVAAHGCHNDSIKNSDMKFVYIDTGVELPGNIETAYRYKDKYPTMLDIVHNDKPPEEIIKNGYPLISKGVTRCVSDVQRAKVKYNDTYKESYTYKRIVQGHGRYSLKEKQLYLLDVDVPVNSNCCNDFKMKPLRKWEKQECRYYPFTGEIKEESRNRRDGIAKQGLNRYNASIVKKSTPLGIWTQQDIIRYTLEHDLDYSCEYGRILEENGVLRFSDEQRTGCYICPYGACREGNKDNSLLRLERKYPEIHRKVISDVEKGGLGFRKSYEIQGIKYSNYL